MVASFKDELLAASVGMILMIPREFLKMSFVLRSLETAFRLGLSYEPLALQGVEALEKWLHVAPDKVQPYLPTILPLLADYLQSRRLHEQELEPIASDDAPKTASAAPVTFKVIGSKLRGASSTVSR
jgi:hypothetical protein